MSLRGAKMNEISLNPSPDNFAIARPNDWNLDVVATLDGDDFERARAAIPDFARYADYDDWLDSRFGLTIGLCSSGVDAKMFAVDLSAFLAWCLFAGLTPSEKQLDEYAALVRVMREGLKTEVALTVIAMASEAEFLAYFDLMDAFQCAGDYAGWRARREAALQAALASGNLALRMPAPIKDFLEWARCLGAGSSEALLDRYAFLALEALACECVR
jgi:hypothetical protein